MVSGSLCGWDRSPGVEIHPNSARGRCGRFIFPFIRGFLLFLDLKIFEVASNWGRGLQINSLGGQGFDPGSWRCKPQSFNN